MVEDIKKKKNRRKELRKISWDKEKENAAKMGLVMDVYLDKSLNYVEKMNPFTALVDKIPTVKEKEKEKVEIDWSTIKSYAQSAINTWLETFDETLKAGKSLPVDLVSKATELAKRLKEEKEERHEETGASTS